MLTEQAMPPILQRLAAASLALCLVCRGASQPDIVIIMADDMGFSDPACFGGEIPTPSLDRLAASGIRLTHCRNAGMCVASRASLLSGRWWPSALRGFEKADLLPEKLHDGGYRTALIGKWHLKGHPLDQGFDHFFGFLGGFADHFTGSSDYFLDRRPFRDFKPDDYSTVSFADRAIGFVESTPRDQPLFLMLAFQAPHNPLQAPPEAIARLRGKYSAGWKAVRENRIRRQTDLGLLAPGTPLPDYPENLPDWASLNPQQRDLEDLRMATYAAMIEIIDRETGRLADALERTGRAKNTLLVFLSDNGADPFSVADAAMLAKGKLPGDRASNFQPGLGWAHAANAPWRLNKISQHSGGVTTGAILRWPAGIPNPGSINATPVHFVDLMPTMLAAAQITPAETDGVSFLPLIQGKPWQRGQPMFFQYADNRAIRTPERTLVEVDGGGWELYDTTRDPLETSDLASERPAEVRQLADAWSQWWHRQNQGRPYRPESTANSPHYSPQGDRGSGKPYQPSEMPPKPADP
jgi:arylsulfatase A-like enzyme